MKKLLFSSLVLLLLGSFSCAGNSKASKADETHTEMSATKSESQSTPKVVAQDTSTSIEQKSGVIIEEAPQHGVPNQSKLDSVKNSYPKKR